jgi:5-hydroxyisourate hydrolase-like protein (transthyretin family)
MRDSIPPMTSFRVHGSVVENESGRPLAAMLVRVYDKDLALDDFLGETRTDDAGRFEVTFTEDRFKDLIESRPDL